MYNFDAKEKKDPTSSSFIAHTPHDFTEDTSSVSNLAAYEIKHLCPAKREQSPTFVFFVLVFLNVLLNQYILGITCLVLDVLLGGNNVAVKLPLQFKIFLYKLAEMILLP